MREAANTATSSAVQDANAWTVGLACQLLDLLPPESRDRLGRVRWVATAPDTDLAGAALLARLASSYAANETPDGLVERLIECADLDRAGARSLALTAVLIVRVPAIPGPRWWQPFLLAEHLAIACARRVIAAGGHPHNLLARRLWLDGELLERAAETARHAPGLEYAIEIDSPQAPPSDDVAHAGDLDGRPDLAAAQVAIRRLAAANTSADAAGDNRLRAAISREADRLTEAAAGLSLLELDILDRPDADQRLLMRAADLARRFVVVTPGEGPSALPDLVDGERPLPRNLDLLLGIGMHSYQQRAGPIISWSIVFEGAPPAELAANDDLAIGVGLREEVTDATELVVSFDPHGDPVNAPITYPADSARASVSLAILALHHTVRLNLYGRDRNRGLRHLAQRAIVLDEPLVGQIRGRAVARCAALLADGEAAAQRAIDGELRVSPGQQALSGFTMQDWGKSEQLIEASTPVAALGPDREASAEQATALSTARTAMLRAEADRIERPSPQADAVAASMSEAYIRLVQETRATAVRGRWEPDRDAELRRITDDAVTPGRAVAHLALGSQGLEAIFATRDDPGDVRLERVALPIDTTELAYAVVEDDGSKIALVDRPGGAGGELGARLAEMVDRLRVRELVLCPTRFLHRLPFHALPVASGARLIDRVDVLYAPSAAILTQLARTPLRPGGTVVAAFGLHDAAAEAAVVEALTDDPISLVGSAATAPGLLAALGGAKALHVCSHGVYLPDDVLGSHLRLAPTPGGPDRLSVARILADANVTGMDLAVLGACLSGSGQTPTSAMDVPGGIDSALLAAGVRNVVSAIWEIHDFAALLFHAQLYLQLSSGASLMDAYRSGVDLLRSGAWRYVRASSLGTFLELLDVDLDEEFDDLAPGDDDEGETAEDFSELEHWTAYRVCGLGRLG